MTVQSMTTMLSISIATGFLASSALAVTSSQFDGGTKPLITPMAHTNQDDEEDEKNMFSPIPIDKELGLTINGSFDFDSITTVTKLAIISNTPVNGTGIEDLGIFEGDIVSSSNYFNSIESARGFLSPVPPSTEGKISSGSDGFNAPAVPAPGVLGLLALAGLSTGRRRRR
ncbi:MAG: hypothetical protein P8M22_12495 [Phycisphaerales bacterium]|nr:hypothetical protein [Phycisphaerales bacterium]